MLKRKLTLKEKRNLMKRVILFIIMVMAAIVISTTPALAEEAIVTANCDEITFTAPADARVIFGLDSSPPGEVSNGNSVTQQFFPLGINAAIETIVMDTHHWTAATIVHGVQVAYQAGDVHGCAFLHLDTAVTPEVVDIPVVERPRRFVQPLELNLPCLDACGK